jgi:hypothetical protein
MRGGRSTTEPRSSTGSGSKNPTLRRKAMTRLLSAPIAVMPQANLAAIRS